MRGIKALLLMIGVMIGLGVGTVIMESSEAIGNWPDTTRFTDINKARKHMQQCTMDKKVVEIRTEWNSPAGQPRRPIAWNITC